MPKLEPIFVETAARTDLITIIDADQWPLENIDEDRHLPHVAFFLRPDSPGVPKEVLKKTRLVEIADHDGVTTRMKKLKDIHPEIVVAVRIKLDSAWCRAGCRACSGRRHGGDPCGC